MLRSIFLQPSGPLRLRLTRSPHRTLACALLLLAAGVPTATPAASPPKLYQDRIEPHWFANNTRFWYRNELPRDGREFVVVTAEPGLRQPAFDHARTATALGSVLGHAPDPNRLPIDTLEFGANSNLVALVTPDGTWELNLADYTVRAVPGTGSTNSGLPVLAEPVPSRRTGPETAILFENRLSERVFLHWVDDSGQRQPYGSLEPGENRRQHTFAGHVWVITRPQGIVATFMAGASARRAIIDGRHPDPRPEPNRRGRTARDRGADASRTTNPAALRSPDGQWEAFVRDHNLWVRNLRQNAESQLSFDGSLGFSFHKDTQRARLVGMDYEEPEAPPTLPEAFWSPDSRHLLALQTRSVPERRVQIVESSPRDQLQPRLISYPYLKAGDEIPIQTPRLFDIARSRELPFDRSGLSRPWSLDAFRWAPDGTRFTFIYQERGHQAARVFLVSLNPTTSPDAPTSADLRLLVDETCPTFFDYSNKTYLEILDGRQEMLWMSERSGWNHLYRLDARTGKVLNPVTRGEWVVRSIDRVDADAGQVWFRAGAIVPGQDPYHVHLARVNLDGSDLRVLTQGDGTHEIQWSPDRRFFIDTWSRVDQPPIIELRRAHDGSKACDLERADASEIVADRGRLPERFVAPGRDGTTEIWGILHRPRDFDPSRRYAVVENIYAGPHGQHVPKAFRAAYRHQQEIADRGFVVVQIDGMGTNWRSKRFHDVAWKNLADAGFPDRIAWLRAAAQRFPELDLARVGIYGGSAGGQNALGALLTQGDFYRAGVADCGCHDNRMDKIWWSEAWMGWPVGPHYAEQSNVTLAHQLRGNLMLFVGELDKNVDPSSTTQVVNALIRANKDFDFVLMTGSGHGSAESDYGRRRRADFFVRHLGPPAK